MSFEDIQAVDFDYDEGTFTMVTNSGQTRTYNIDKEADLVNNIIEAGNRGELDIYVIEETTTSGQTFSDFEAETRQAYYDKYGEDFESWNW